MNSKMSYVATGIEYQMTSKECPIPDGVYDGIWGGYICRVSLDGMKYDIRTDIGIRGRAVAAKVRVREGLVEIEPK